MNLPATSRSWLAWIGGFLGLALFSSGSAGLINQVVWQRSLKVLLGGSETVCSTVVVLVFMAGLGIGSIWMGRRAPRLRNPLRTFGILELALAAVNLLICGVLAADLSYSVFQLQQLATSSGVPLLVLYALGAGIVLFVPCLLMGATLPLAAEACQRNLGIREARILGLLFFVNTLGSVLGTVVSSGFMIASLGLSRSLVVAAGMNLLAGLVLVALWLVWGRQPALPAAIAEVSTNRSIFRPTREETLAFWLGFCSLGYEMYLFRLIPQRHEPLPFTFAAVLTGFLLFWSLGAAWSSRRKPPSISLALRLCAWTAVATVPFLAIDRLEPITDTWSLAWFVVARCPYFFPCVFFGCLFGLVARQAAHSWGHDLGRVYGWNTCGSCLGILAMTFVGYEMPFYLMVLLIAFLLLALQSLADAPLAGWRPRVWPLAAPAVVVICGLTLDFSRLIPGQRMYSGRDGVIIVFDSGDVSWDGLWHSRLAQNNDHVGTNNWALAVCPVLCHSTGEINDVCVIGVATGITASTLAKLDTVKRVDAYDITRVLEKIYRDYPAGTLHLAENPKINIIWQDARSGLALDPQKYDVIQTQPLYLKQSGSGLLNSVEFYRLVSERLQPGGVFCLYSNGTAEQAYAVRQTAARVFPHRVSFSNGYLCILSNDPIVLDEATLDRRLARSGPFWDEVRGWPKTRNGAAILELVDRPSLMGGPEDDLVVTDDRPIVEYADFLARWVRRNRPGLKLPVPLHRDSTTNGH